MVNISFPKQQFNTCIQYLVFCSGRWKKRIGRQHMTLTLCQNAACSNEFFFWRVDYILEEKVLTEQIWFLPLILCWEVWHKSPTGLYGKQETGYNFLLERAQHPQKTPWPDWGLPICSTICFWNEVALLCQFLSSTTAGQLDWEKTWCSNT